MQFVIPSKCVNAKNFKDLLELAYVNIKVLHITQIFVYFTYCAEIYTRILHIYMRMNRILSRNHEFHTAICQITEYYTTLCVRKLRRSKFKNRVLNRNICIYIFLIVFTGILEYNKYRYL